MEYLNHTYNDFETVGKIEDAGDIVQGGGIDRYWKRHPISLDFKKLFNDTISDDWLFSSNLALEHFNLRSIEFGNWMNQKDRANFLYSTALSLHHLALLFNLKDEQIGLNKKLSIALGARGSGGAKAHYEPLERSVINLTKTKGIGSLAHEFAHAIDNLISFHTGDKKQSYVSGGRATRKGYDESIAKNGNYFEKQFEDFFNVLYFDKKGNATAFSQYLTSTNNDYLNRRNEVFARTLEVYVHYKLNEQGIKNEFLVKRNYQNKVYPNINLVLQVSKYIENIIKRAFTLMKKKTNLNGVALFSGYDGLRKTLIKNASLDDTLKNMQRIARRDVPQVTALAQALQGDSVAITAQNIWNYLRENTRYKLDQNGIEELRTPARGLVDGRKGLTDPNYGIDCDDYTILISAILLNLNIRHEYRVTAYQQKGKFQHIYPVAFDDLGGSYIMDVVPEIPHFNYEAKPIIDLKTVPMELHELSGVDEETLIATIDEESIQDLEDELNEPLDLSGFEEDEDEEDNENEDFLMFEDSFLSGVVEVENEEDAEIVLNGANDVLNLLDQGVFEELNKLRLTFENEKVTPTALSHLVDVNKELSIVKMVMQHWGDLDDRKAAIQSAIKSGTAHRNFYLALAHGTKVLNAQGLQGVIDDDDEPIYLARVDMQNSQFDELLNDPDPELQGLGNIGRLNGRIGFLKRISRKLRRFGRKAKRGIRKVAKKAIKVIKRINPASVILRAAIRGVLRLNLFNISTKLLYGYLSQKQAIQRGMQLHIWRKLVRARQRAERFYRKRGGRVSHFRRAVVKGRARRKTGIRLSGVGAAATAAGGSTAAASPFIVFIKKILAKIKTSKLFKKGSRLVKRVRGKVRNSKNLRKLRRLNNRRKRLMQQRALIRQQRRRRGASSPVQNRLVTRPSTSIRRRSTPRSRSSIMPPTTNTSFTPNTSLDMQPMGIKDKIIAFFKKHKKRVYAVGIVGALAIVGVIFWKKSKDKKKRSLAGVKAARTRARNRKRSTIALPAPRKRTTTRKPTATRAIGSARNSKNNNANRLKLMHKKAKQLQKQHPRSKYSTLLKRAAKMI